MEVKMNVRELLIAMTGGFKGFDAPAVTAMADVFRRKLERYEGPELANAWVEVAASFKATGNKPYPLPSDFEDVLPRAAKMPKSAGGSPLDFKGHGERKAALLDDWCQVQRPEIAATYGPRVAFWCEAEVRERAGLLAWKEDAPTTIRLGEEDIKKIFESVVSRDRMDAFGPAVLGKPAYGETAQEQMEKCRTIVVRGGYSSEEIAEPVEARRPAHKGPTVDLRPEEFTVGDVPPWLDDGAPPPEDYS
jgi:hypothetical protein